MEQADKAFLWLFAVDLARDAVDVDRFKVLWVVGCSPHLGATDVYGDMCVHAVKYSIIKRGAKMNLGWNLGVMKGRLEG
jgi:hypothetical protein